MMKKLVEIVAGLLLEKKVDAVLSLKKEHEGVAPHLFTNADEVTAIAIKPTYPLANLLRQIQAIYPDRKIALVARGCEERACIELAKRNQLDIEKVVFIGVACTEEEARECNCTHPYPSRIEVGEKTDGVKSVEKASGLLAKNTEERLEFWRYMFSKCIKCYGCKNICPFCICEECILEDELWVKVGEIPPEFPTFHLVRAYHLADKCVGCNECETVCPMNIPLTTLYLLLKEDMKTIFGYEPGGKDEKPPLLTPLAEHELKGEI